MAIREGLSFSDYFDDSVPYEVKPVPSTIPMEEDDRFIGRSDIPTQSKDLFKGLWETHEKSRVLASNGYWLTPECEFEDAYIGGNSHDTWAKNYLRSRGISSYQEGATKTLKDIGFIRVLVQEELMLISYTVPPTEKQWDVLIDSARRSNVFMIDQMAGKTIKDKINISPNRISPHKNKLTEEIKGKKQKRGRNKDKERLFIESMMPDDTDTFKSHLAQLFAYLQKELQLKTVPKVKLLSDEKNAEKVLGKTAYYDPDTRTINLYITERHQKDILRSFSHEVIHHWQHENEKLQTSKTGRKQGEDPEYAQHNPWLRQMEKQAYLLGNILFRDWEDQKKAKDRKSGKKMTEETPVIRKSYPPSHPYRKHVEPKDPKPAYDKNNIEEKTYSSDVKHISWDQGVINKAMGSLGMFQFQKTAKTLCEKNVGVNRIDNHHPTCPLCLERKRELNTRPKGLEEKTYILGKEYPPKKMDYSG